MLAVIIIAMLGTYEVFKLPKSFRKSSRSVYFSRKETPQLFSYSRKVLWHKTFSEALGKKDTKNTFSIKHHHVSLPPQTPPHSNVRNVAKIKQAGMWTQSSTTSSWEYWHSVVGSSLGSAIFYWGQEPLHHITPLKSQIFPRCSYNTQARIWQRADA